MSRNRITWKQNDTCICDMYIVVIGCSSKEIIIRIADYITMAKLMKLEINQD